MYTRELQTIIFLRQKTFNKLQNNFTKFNEWMNEMLYLTTHSTYFIYGYMVSDMVNDHCDSEKGNLLPPHVLLFPINT